MFGSLNAKARSPENAAPSRVFISYSRDDMEVADRFVAALEERRIEVFIDRRSLPLIGRWQEEIEAMILASDAVIWLVSRRSIRSTWCHWELEVRDDQEQMLIPVLVDDTRPEELPEAYAAWQCLSFFELGDFDGEIDKLAEALRAPYAWIKQQRWLADQASRKNNRLRGKALTDAESWLDGPPDTTWLQANPAFAPKPTAAIRAMIERSRRLARRDRYLASAAAVFGMVVIAGVAWYTIGQRQIADSQHWARASSQATERGNAGSGLLLALKGLPDGGDVLRRPVVTESRRAAYAAISALREHTVFKGHGAALTHAEMSSDGRLLLTSSSDGTARLWPMDGAHQGESLVLKHQSRPSNGAPSSVTMARLGPDGSRIVTVSNDHTGMLWNAKGESIARLERHTRPVLFARFSPDGRFFVTAGEDYTARLWSAADGRHVKDFKGHGHFVITAEFSPDGRLLATASSDGTARIWPVDGTAEPIVLDEHEDRVLSVAFDETGSLVATTSRDGNALLWTTDGKLSRRLDGHAGVVNRLRFAPDRPLAITSSDDNTAKLWNLSDGEEIGTLAGHDARMIDARFSADGRRLVSSSADETARVWDVASSEMLHLFEGHEDRVRSAIFDPGGERVLSVSADGKATIWDSRTGQVIRSFDAHKADVWAAGFSPDGASIVTGSADGQLLVTDIQGRAEPRRLVGHGDNIRSAAFSPDGRHVVSASWDRTARLWDAKTGEELHVARNADIILGAAFDPAGTRFGYLVKERVIFRPAFPTVETLVAAAKSEAPAVQTGVGFDADRSDEARTGLLARIAGLLPGALGQK